MTKKVTIFAPSPEVVSHTYTSKNGFGLRKYGGFPNVSTAIKTGIFRERVG
jgi:hypothetical protein